MAHLKDIIGDTVRERCERAHLTPLEDEVRKCVLRVFAATGRPPDPGEIAEMLSGTPDIPGISPVIPEITVIQALAMLHAADILRLRGGAIVAAYPFSAAETRHLVVFSDGHAVNALCATDALGIHFMLGEDIIIRSLCPECGREIVIVLKNGKILSLDPPTAIEFVKARDRCGCHADACCPDLNFFCDADHLSRWQEQGYQSRDGVVVPLDEALEESRGIFEGLSG
jgi:mercuric reductase